MEEVFDVPPRTAFKYKISVDSPTLISWSFSSRRRNVSFGVFKQRDVALALDDKDKKHTIMRSASTQSTSSFSALATAPSRPSSADLKSLSQDHFISASASPSAQSSKGNTSVILPRNELSASPVPMSATSTTAPLAPRAFQNILDEEHSKPRRRSTLGAITAKTAQVLHIGSGSSHAYASAAPGVESPTLHEPLTSEQSRKNHKQRKSNFTDKTLEPVVPIAFFNSSETAITGSLSAEAPGVYVLVFDNTFSKNRKKRIFLTVSLQLLEDANAHGVQPNATAEKKPETDTRVLSGWLLKKKNRRMPGWIERWVSIDAHGQLTYRKSPREAVRGRVFLRECMIRLNQKLLRIDIDAGSGLFHFKTLSDLDFDKWSRAIQFFGADSRSPGQLSFGSSADLMYNSASSPISLSSIKLAQRLVDSKEALLLSMQTLERDLAQKASSDTIAKDLELQTRLFNTFADVAEQISNSKIKYEWGFGACLRDANRLRRKGGQDLVYASALLNNSAVPQTAEALLRSVNMKTTPVLPTSGSAALGGHRRQASTASSIENYFDAEESATGTNIFIDETASEGSIDDNVHFDDDEDDYDEDNTELDSVRAAEQHPDEVTRLRRLHRKRKTNYSRFHSISMSHSASESSAGESADDTASLNNHTVVAVGSQVTVIETVLRGSGGIPLESSSSFSSTSSLTSSSSLSSNSILVVNRTLPAVAEHVVQRRSCLPAPTVNSDNVNFFSILKKNIGKDLSSVTMPVQLNEPISLLQRLCEEVEYSELLDLALSSASEAERLAYVAAFAVSGYMCSVGRTGKKPWNPLLGETFELVRADMGMRFIAEKVSHNPPVMACYAEGSRGWEFFEETSVKSKFWGKSMEFIPSGTVHVVLKLPNGAKEHYTWNKLTSCVRNLFGTSRYLEYYGDIKVFCERMGSGGAVEKGGSATVTFKDSGIFGNGPKYDVSGHVSAASGSKVYLLSGRWDSVLLRSTPADPDTLHVLWRAHPLPPNSADMYGFTKFAIELNEVTPDIENALPPTDSRKRPDQRLYEEGNVEQAEAVKLSLEQNQRDRRKANEKQNIEHKPVWFAKQKLPNWSSSSDEFIFNGKYWNSRQVHFKDVSKFVPLW